MSSGSSCIATVLISRGIKRLAISIIGRFGREIPALMFCILMVISAHDDLVID